MNILGREMLFFRKPHTPVSGLAGVLPRIRTIRDQCNWQPLSSAAATQHRRERIRTARQQIIYHPVPYDRVFEFRLPLRRTWWLWLAGGLAVLCAGALVWGLAVARSSRSNYSFGYQLSTAPSILSEQLALDRAKASLSQVVTDAHLWRPQEFLNPRMTAEGTPERHLLRISATEGLITFVRSNQSNASWVVYLQLFGSNLHCTAFTHTINKR